MSASFYELKREMICKKSEEYKLLLLYLNRQQTHPEYVVTGYRPGGKLVPVDGSYEFTFPDFSPLKDEWNEYVCIDGKIKYSWNGENGNAYKYYN